MPKYLKYLWFCLIIIFLPFEGNAIALDEFSLNCLSCHDAIIGKDVVINLCPNLDCDHPIGMDYRQVSMGNPGLADFTTLNSTVKSKLLISNNVVSCITCHVPYSPDDHSRLSVARTSYPTLADPMLVMDNRKSELCMSCHHK